MGDATTFLTTAIQAVGLLLMAALLRSLGRAFPGIYLHYWSLGWVALAVGLALRAAAGKAGGFGPAAVAASLALEYGFCYLLWLGCRAYSTGRPFDRRSLALLAPAVGFAAVGPWLFASPRHLTAVHAVVVGGWFLVAFVAASRGRPDGAGSATGYRLLRASLVGLAVLFLHYATVTGVTAFIDPDAVGLKYLEYAILYDVLLQTGLGFGMVVLAADRVRGELEAKNRQLAAAAAELAAAARTDALTGLLNRRAFEELPAAHAGLPFRGSVAVIDVNDLKVLNDRYGHAAGDAALQTVARALRNCFRVTDPLFRTGGDEFVAVLDGLPADELAERLGRVDQALALVRVPGIPDPVTLTVAWGTATFAAAADLAAACDRADADMYRCKKWRKGGTPRPVGAR